MSDNMTSQNTDLFSWDTLFIMIIWYINVIHKYKNSYLQESLNMRHFTCAVLVCSKSRDRGS
jgi:hypothetical protein